MATIHRTTHRTKRSARIRCAAGVLFAFTLTGYASGQQAADKTAAGKTAAGKAATTQPATRKPTALENLLQELAATKEAAWQQRRQTMTTQAAASRSQAKALRDRAKLKHAAATERTNAAKSLSAEVERLETLRSTLAALEFAAEPKPSQPKHSAAEQTKPKSVGTNKLQGLLANLRKLPDTTWQARTTLLRKQAEVHSKAATKWQDERKQLTKQATAKEASAKALAAEATKLSELQTLIAGMTLRTQPPMGAALAASSTPTAKPARKQAMPAAANASTTAKAVATAKPAIAKPVSASKAAGKPIAIGKPVAKAKQPSTPEPVAVEPDKDLVTYQDHVYAIFDENCIGCHDAGDASGGLDLSTFDATLQGGSSGQTLKPGNADGSRLYLLVSHREKPTMPPDEARIDKPLIETIRKWIQQGAPKDLPHARKLATARAQARTKAAAAAANASAAAVQTPVVMPESLPRVPKALPARPGTLRTVAASPNAPLLAVPGFGQVLLMQQNPLRELGVLPFAFGQVETMCFSQDGTVLLAAGGTAGQRGGAVLFDVRTGRELGRYGENGDVVLAAAVAPNGDLVAVGNTRRRLQVFRVGANTDKPEIAWQEVHDDWVTAIAFSPDGALLASGDRQGNLAVREAQNGREVHKFRAASGVLTALAFAPSSKQLAAAGSDRSVSLYRMSDGRRLFRELRHQDEVLCLTWRTAQRLMSSGADGRILHWKLDGNRDRELPRVADWVYGIAASHDGSWVFTADWRGRLIAFDAKTRKAIAKITPLAVTQ